MFKTLAMILMLIAVSATADARPTLKHLHGEAARCYVLFQTVFDVARGVDDGLAHRASESRLQMLIWAFMIGHQVGRAPTQTTQMILTEMHAVGDITNAYRDAGALGDYVAREGPGCNRLLANVPDRFEKLARARR